MRSSKSLKSLRKIKEEQISINTVGGQFVILSGSYIAENLSTARKFLYFQGHFSDLCEK